ncbi:substrate-binding domain-containing protein [Butyrivibrio sp. YAB3001]|uniref:substrate-binding domain-containing protein n=1 Tax=Butyrivibrio sp. YAB3001 TaxID=1520812 RepID=UPI001FA905AA|nr:sugar-binding protein [Butyrivibrio sp. YAB3001]
MQSKKAISILLINIILVVFSLSGCGSSSVPENANFSQEETVTVTDTHSDDGRTVIGISMPDMLLERWNRDGAYLMSQFEKNGCEVILSFANNLIDTQINDIRSMIASGADLLVIAAVDGAAISGVLDEAKAANVKVIAYDRLIMSSDVVDYYVSFDNYAVGRMQANYVIGTLGVRTAEKPLYIEFVSGDPVDNNSRYFYKGAMDTLSEFLESGMLISLSNQTSFYETATAQWSSDIAQQRLQILLNSYYPEGTRLDAVLCANDSTALGAARAIEADYAGDNQVVLTGQDGDIANIYNIINGTQSMTVFKDLSEESIVTVSLALSLLSGNTPGKELIDSADWDFSCSFNTEDYDNGKKIVPSYLLKPIQVTADNIEQKLFDTGYYKRNSAGLIYSAK